MARVPGILACKLTCGRRADNDVETATHIYLDAHADPPHQDSSDYRTRDSDHDTAPPERAWKRPAAPKIAPRIMTVIMIRLSEKCRPRARRSRRC